MRVRPATQADKAAVLAFCQHTFEWGDYLSEVWDLWLNQTDGKLLVGEVDGRPVAVGNVRLIAPGEAWLQGLRIDPNYRHAGLATAFTEHATRFAHEMGACVARLMTLSTNYAIHKVMDRLGYRRASSFISYRAPAAADETSAVEGLAPQCLAAVMSYLERSPAFAAMGRLHCGSWICHELTAAKMERRLERGDVWARRVGEAIVALAVVGRGVRDNLVLEFVDGEERELVEFARATRARAAQSELPVVEAVLAEIPYVTGAFAAAGFDADGYEAFWIYEKELPDARR